MGTMTKCEYTDTIINSSNMKIKLDKTNRSVRFQKNNAQLKQCSVYVSKYNDDILFITSVFACMA